MEVAFRRWRRLAAAGFLKLVIQSSCRTLQRVSGPGAPLEEHGPMSCPPLRALECQRDTLPNGEGDINLSVIRAGRLSGGEGDVDIPRHDGDPLRRADGGGMGTRD